MHQYPSIDEVSAATENSLPKRKLYALLVGINDYRDDLILNESGKRVIFPALSGCVPDTEKINDYLNLETDTFLVDIKRLANTEATRINIIHWFRTHLGKAEKDDVVFFYFSGHGTREYADKTVWTQESDGLLECLVCYYDEKTIHDFRLADKELRFLIHELSQKNPHIVTIYDCCHSGDNTRNGEVTTSAFPAIEKKIPYVFPGRPWSEFVFGNVLDEQTVRQNGLPEGGHVQMAACDDHESALEVQFEKGGEGVFTRTLLKVLNASAGDITYFALRNRVRQYLRNVYQQTPRIYIANDSDALLYATFLTKKSSGTKAAFGEVTYNEKTGWLLDMGGIQGIGDKTKTITVIHPDDLAQQFIAAIGRIETDTTELAFNEIDQAKLNKNQYYKAYIEGLLAHTLLVNFQNEDGLLQEQRAVLDELFRKDKSYIKLTEDTNSQSKADYVVYNRNGRFYITKPNDPYRPLIAPIKTGYGAASSVLTDDLKHISNWTFLERLSNTSPGTILKDNPLKIEVVYVGDDDTETPIPVMDNEATIDFRQYTNHWETSLRYRLTNTTNTRLYCAALYLTSRFRSYVNYLNPTVYPLGPGESVALRVKDKMTGNDRTSIRAGWGEIEKLYNLPMSIDHIKFIVSTNEFAIDSLKLDALPSPHTPTNKTRSDELVLKSNMEMDDDPEPELKGWTTQKLTLHFRNPEPDIIDEEDLKAMLDDTDIADFALGLYFDSTFDDNLETVYTLKKNILVRAADQSLGQKGFAMDRIIDLANWWARNRRNNRFLETRRRLPNHPVLVSEGDSWFQHPRVRDIIDCIARSYPVYCVAAAGDTLENYVKEGEQAEFLQAIKKHNPVVFLISGGGNDVLGNQFRHYLVNQYDPTAKPGEKPERFLKTSLLQKLDQLSTIYAEKIFGQLSKSYPNLYIIAHGYDNIIPLDINTDGWLGRYMIDIGIGPTDRRAVIHYILDEFNKRLKKTAATKGFEKVTYIDVRGTVGTDQWYDEIHPNEKGFQLVADKFLACIRKVAPVKTSG